MLSCVLYWKQLSQDPARMTPFICVFHDHDFYVSKSSPVSFASIIQFKDKMKKELMKVLDRCSLELRTATSRSLLSSHPECCTFNLSFSERE